MQKRSRTDVIHSRRPHVRRPTGPHGSQIVAHPGWNLGPPIPIERKKATAHGPGLGAVIGQHRRRRAFDWARIAFPDSLPKAEKIAVVIFEPRFTRASSTHVLRGGRIDRLPRSTVPVKASGLSVPDCDIIFRCSPEAASDPALPPFGPASTPPAVPIP